MFKFQKFIIFWLTNKIINFYTLNQFLNKFQKFIIFWLIDKIIEFYTLNHFLNKS